MSSHREAPEISKDPVADNTDTYAFVSPVVAVFLGWALAGEAFPPRTLLAAGVALTGVILIVRAGGVSRPTAPSVPSVPAGSNGPGLPSG